MVVWPGKNGFHKKCKNWDNIAVYTIASSKSQWKNKQIKNMNSWIWYFFICVLEGKLQWNCWICKMFDYLKGSIVKFELNFERASENKHESKWRWQISSKTGAFRIRQFNHCKTIVFSKYHLIKTFRLILISFLKMIMEILLPILI